MSSAGIFETDDTGFMKRQIQIEITRAIDNLTKSERKDKSNLIRAVQAASNRVVRASLGADKKPQYTLCRNKNGAFAPFVQRTENRDCLSIPVGRWRYIHICWILPCILYLPGYTADDEIRQLDCHATNVARNDKGGNSLLVMGNKLPVTRNW